MKEFLASTDLFRDLSAADYQQIEAQARTCSFRKNEVIFRKGDDVTGLYAIRTGRIKLYAQRKISQREEIISVINPRGCFDVAAIFSGDKHHTNAQALEPSEALFISPQVLQDLFRSSKIFSERVVGFLSLKILELSEELTDLSLASTKERLAKYLIREYEIKKRPSSFNLSLNQSQLASHLGTVREIVSRDLASLKKSRVINSRQGEISVLDPDELGKIAEGFSFRP